MVSEIVELLSRCKPLIKATEFIGQSGGKEKGMPQAKQLQVSLFPFNHEKVLFAFNSKIDLDIVGLLQKLYFTTLNH